MFYSQFILAKKGPLGTIWIAAHLERKLRKNQVADTDIGVSVDSILSPDVPIALRLSSHLLLGVVRIYSRKVNYLFHDCSEALLKVKQAFRSTAVDLPPEESTAPYHSITLPETFDLDDFELPDSDNFQGNFVDHHVSTREQITLQDSMDGLVYSTSQFGLDERFGDGDTSQIGLDLDEELLLDKVAASGHSASLLDSDNLNPEASGQPMTPYVEMDIDDDDITTGEASTVLMRGPKDAYTDPNAQKETVVNNPALGGNQIQSLHFDGHGLPTELFPSTDPSTQSTQHASYTPGLVEEVYPTNAHINEDPAHGLVNKTVLFHSEEVNNNSLNELECHTPKFMAQESIKNTTSEENLHIRDTNEAGDCFSVDNKRSETDVSHVPQDSEKISVTDMNSISPDVGHKVSSPTSVLAEQLKPTSPSSGILDRAPAFPDSGDRTQSLQNGDNSSGRPSTLDVDRVRTEVSVTDIKENTASTSLLKESHDMPHQSNEGVSVNPLLTDVLQTAREGILGHVSVSHMEFPGSHNLNDFTEGNRHDVSQTAREGILEHVSVSHMEFPGSHNLNDLTEGNRHDANPPLVSEPSHHLDKAESKGCLVTEVRDVQRSVGPDEMFSEPRHVLRACSSILKQPDTVVPADRNLASLAILGNQDPDRASGVLGPIKGVDFQPTSIRDTSLVSNLVSESIRSSSQEAGPSTVDGASYTVSSKDQIGNLNLTAGLDLAVPQTERMLSPPEAVPFGASTVEGASYTVSSKDHQLGNLNFRAGFDLAVPQTERLFSPSEAVPQTERLFSPPEAVPFGASTVEGASFPGVNFHPTSTRDTSLVSNLGFEPIHSSSQEARPSTVEGASYTVSSKDQIGNLNFTAGFDLAVPQTERLLSPSRAVPFGASTVDGASYTVSSKDHQLGNLNFRAGFDLAVPQTERLFSPPEAVPQTERLFSPPEAVPQTERLFSPPEAVPFGVSSVGGASYTVSSKDQLGNLNFRAGFGPAVPQTERFLLAPEAVPFGVSTVNGALYAASSKDQFGNLNFRGGFDTAVPQTERLLSAPEAVPFGGGYLPVQSTLEKKVSTERGVSETEFNTLAGKKRQLMETTPVEKDNSFELSWMRSKNAFGSIPDDYDVLSSILAGKRSSALKLKPTPQQPDTSRKRPRVTPKASVAKRKVLVDDTMVLHGDTIRLQLTSTEDIRRMRKKAPCTRSEIWMIQKHLLEDDIFVEPLYTGMSSDLIGMHNRTYDAVKVSEMDVNNLLPEVLIQKNTDFSRKASREETVEPVPVEDGGAVEEPMQKHIQIDNRNSEMGVGDMLPPVPDEVLMQNNTDFGGKASREEIVEPVPVEDGGAIDEPVPTNIHIGNRFSGDHLPTIEIGNQEQTRPITDSASTDLQNVQFDINVSMEIDAGSGEVVGVHPLVAASLSENRCNEIGITNKPLPVAVGVHPLVAATLSENRCNEIGIENESLPVDGSNGVDTVVQNGGNLDIQSIDNDVTFTERSNCRADSTINTVNANEGGIPSAHDVLTENGTSAQKIFESDAPKVLEQNIPADHQMDVCNGSSPHIDYVLGNCLRDDKADVPSDASIPMENDRPLFSNISVGSEGSADPIVAINETKEGIRSVSEHIVGENVSESIRDDTHISPSGPMPLEGISCPPSELNLDREADASVEGENVGRQGAALEGSVDPTSSQVASLAGNIGDEPTIVDRETDASVEGENVGRHEVALEGSADPMSIQVASLAGSIGDEPTMVENTFESNDLGDTLYENDTEFLNFDDDDDEGAVIEEEDDIAPDAEEAGNLDTSGWSSRTRGVAKYLQTLFDAERGRGRKTLSMDNLLTGKTRKEASRMFFETLVLKTRDFVHVEQQNPFGDINIKPKGKLMKSNF